MKIWGINSFSFIEYPWKISCVVYLPWCNFRCGYCHNKEFVLPECISKNITTHIPEDVFFRFLLQRKWLIDAVSICWWEPTLQKDIERFCERIKSMWFWVKLDTNGTNFRILTTLIKNGLIDYVAMDVKYSLWDYHIISWVKMYLEEIKKSIEYIRQTDTEYEFRTTCIAPFHTAQVIENIGKTIFWAKKWYLQNFRHGETLDVWFLGTSFPTPELLELLEVAKKYVVSAEIRV